MVESYANTTFRLTESKTLSLSFKKSTTFFLSPEINSSGSKRSYFKGKKLITIYGSKKYKPVPKFYRTGATHSVFMYPKLLPSLMFKKNYVRKKKTIVANKTRPESQPPYFPQKKSSKDLHISLSELAKWLI
jgi:hypothetical protein